uniref:RAB19, member RAS onco family n=1 Tax=Latimeria chalumnae TaxID=7897 RepID=H3B6K5_LATCH
MQFTGPDEPFDYLFKIILIGDSNVGKTCVVHHFKTGYFVEKQQNTIGVDFTVRSLEIEGKKVKGLSSDLVLFAKKAILKKKKKKNRQTYTIKKGFHYESVVVTDLKVLFKLQVWDTAGQERFQTITQSYYRSAHGAIIAYDITRRVSFESVTHWLHEVEKFGAANVILMLIGNKSDLAERREVLFEDACTFAEKHSLMAVLETSAKESQNIEEAFQLMARALMARNGLHFHSEGSRNSFHVDSKPVIISQSSEDNSNCSC